MGLYVTDGSNMIGTATTDSWAAVWTVDTPYIHVLRRDFYEEHADEIREAAVRGREFSDDGQTGALADIGTGGDLDEKGWPKGYETASEYVAAELAAWTREDGGYFEQAMADGYGN